jgi:hypothetical protein
MREDQTIDAINDDEVLPSSSMNHIFPEAHAYQVPPSILKASYPFNTPPLRIPYDIYINRYLTMWIMPCNHITHALFFGTIILTIVRFWITPTIELIALHHESRFGHFGSLQCFLKDCPEEVLLQLWHSFYFYTSLLLVVLTMAWTRVFRRFRGRPWMDNNFTEFNRLPMVTSSMRWMVDESCAREVACCPQLLATATESNGEEQDLVPNVWNMDGEDWQFQLRSTVERALDVVYNDGEDQDKEGVVVLVTFPNGGIEVNRPRSRGRK